MRKCVLLVYIDKYYVTSQNSHANVQYLTRQVAFILAIVDYVTINTIYKTAK